jgi:hypothetical protein
MRAIRRRILALARGLAVAAAALAMTGNALATSATTDASDIWWSPSEPGWGMQLVNTGTFIFATVFIYGTDGKPTWITGELSLGTNFTFTGPTYANTGPYYGGPWNSALVTQRQVGTMTFVLDSVDTGQLSYTVDGVAVTKAVERQFLTQDSYAGNYLGTVYLATTGCTNAASNVKSSVAGALSITQSAAATTVTFPIAGNGSCTLNGTYTQHGRMGRVDGPYTCTNGEAGTGLMFQMTNEPYMFMARLWLQSPALGCTAMGQTVGLIPQ